jgi:aryl-alcohol dehydrogenase-like predicted oxidoreductase
MKMLDMWRAAVGMTYDNEKPGGYARPIDGRPLSSKAAMPAIEKPALGKRISAFAIGCAFLRKPSDMANVLDTFFEEGGTVFDTAHTYAQGLIDNLLGHWLHSRGVRKDAIIVGKGGMDSSRNFLCLPELIGPQLEESLNRLKTDYLDIYFLHRDNNQVPVGEFVDALDREARAGRIKVFGGSNWNLARVAQANAYAAQNNRTPFKVVSNQFSLAEMIEPAWPGCIASARKKDVDWFKANDVTLFAWSSLARGFFSAQSSPDKRTDPDMIRCWYNDENFARKERARELAKKHNTSLARIALAHVLRQPFSVVPVIGPLTLHELRDSLGALTVSLTADEVSWLRDGRTVS